MVVILVLFVSRRMEQEIIPDDRTDRSQGQGPLSVLSAQSS